MARDNGRLSSNDDWKKRLHNVELSANEEAACVQHYLENKPDLSSLMIRTVEEGWKLSMNYSDFYGLAFVSMTCTREDLPYYKHTFTLRWENPVSGLLVLLWVMSDREEKGTVLDESANRPHDFLETLF